LKFIHLIPNQFIIQMTIALKLLGKPPVSSYQISLKKISQCKCVLWLTVPYFITVSLSEPGFVTQENIYIWWGYLIIYTCMMYFKAGIWIKVLVCMSYISFIIHSFLTHPFLFWATKCDLLFSLSSCGLPSFPFWSLPTVSFHVEGTQ
jgi:hypothetical protein